MYALLIYGFPLILLLFEWGLRSLLLVDSWGFVGPTLAAAGLSFLVPLTRPKTLHVLVPDMPNAVVTTKRDLNFVVSIWILLLLYLFIWCGACYSSLVHPFHQTFGVSTHFAIGIVAYMFSLIMSFVKEKI